MNMTPRSSDAFYESQACPGRYAEVQNIAHK